MFTNAMNNNSGAISLEAIFDFIRRCQFKTIPFKRECPEYGYECEKIYRMVPELPGWYSWVSVNLASNTGIYIGLTGKGQAGLRSSIKEDLWDARIAHWIHVFPEMESEIIRDANRKSGNRYTKEHARYALRKLATHIVWVAVEDKDLQAYGNRTEFLEAGEAYLIKAFQPYANIIIPESKIRSDWGVIYKKYKMDLQAEIEKLQYFCE